MTTSVASFSERTLYCIVLFLNIYIEPFAVHIYQKHFHLHASVAQMQWYYRAIVCKQFAHCPYTVIVLDEAWTHTLHVTGRAASALTD